jgi:hypothetical protein
LRLLATVLGWAPAMLILAIILFGLIAGAAAQLLLGKPAGGIDWSLAFGAGLVTAGWLWFKRRSGTVAS